jgi:hypothetical protein
MSTLWILTADAEEARLYRYFDGQPGLLLTKLFETPGGKVVDNRYRPGEADPPPEYWHDRFARDLGELLEIGAIGDAYNHLIIAAPEHFLAKILDAIGPRTHPRLLCALPKNLAGMDQTELEKYVSDLLRMSARETTPPDKQSCASAACSD